MSAVFDTKRTAPEEVARVIEKALSAARPRKQYQVGYLAHLAGFMGELPQTLLDRILALER